MPLLPRRQQGHADLATFRAVNWQDASCALSAAVSFDASGRFRHPQRYAALLVRITQISPSCARAPDDHGFGLFNAQTICRTV